jgi:hypothetical protein
VNGEYDWTTFTRVEQCDRPNDVIGDTLEQSDDGQLRRRRLLRGRQTVFRRRRQLQKS